MSYISPIRLNIHDQIADSADQIAKRVDEATMQYVYQYVLNMNIEVDKEMIKMFICEDAIRSKAYSMNFAMRITDRELALINYILGDLAKIEDGRGAIDVKAYKSEWCKRCYFKGTCEALRRQEAQEMLHENSD